MKYLSDTSNVFTRYDLNIEVAGQSARKISEDDIFQEVADFVLQGDEEGAEKAVKSALKTKDPVDIINQGLIAGMNEVSRLWEEGVYFLPQVILSSDAMSLGIALCEKKWASPWIKKARWSPIRQKGISMISVR